MQLKFIKPLTYASYRNFSPPEELSYPDKLLLLHFLGAELLKESGLIPLEVQNKVASQGLYDSFEAAAVLAKALADEKAKTQS